MKNSLGIDRFKIQLSIANDLLIDAKSEKDIVFFLYQKQFRTTLFMLEGLCKLYAALHNKKKFEKILEKVKRLEDAFGAYDYYCVQLKDAISNNKIPKEIRNYFSEQLKKEEENVLLLLNNENWISGNRIAKFSKKLKNANWLNAKEEKKAITAAYNKEIDKIYTFCNESLPFTDMELHVHELRRKLRWLSIYPQAGNGLFGLEILHNKQAFQNKYCTKEIVNSPFNKFEVNQSLKHPIYLDKYSFFALSWIINELGKIKDEGLTIHAMIAAAESNKVNNKKSETTNHQAKLNELLKKSSRIVKQFLQENNLKQLIPN